MVVALRPPGREDFVYNPGPDTRLEAGCMLVVMGDVERLSQLSRLVSDEGAETVVVRAATTGHERRELERWISDVTPLDPPSPGGGWVRPDA